MYLCFTYKIIPSLQHSVMRQSDALWPKDVFTYLRSILIYHTIILQIVYIYSSEINLISIERNMFDKS